MSAREFARLVLCPEQSLTAWLTEAAVALIVGASIALAFAGCAAPRAVELEQLSCLGEALAASDAPEELIAEFGGCTR